MSVKDIFTLGYLVRARARARVCVCVSGGLKTGTTTFLHPTPVFCTRHLCFAPDTQILATRCLGQAECQQEY